MHIRVTTDPITLHEVDHPETHPCIYRGDGENGLEIYFETESNKETYMKWEQDIDDKIVLKGDDSDDYVAEG